MKDICIRFVNTGGGWWQTPDPTDLTVYHAWLRKNLPAKNYHIPRNSDSYVYFLEESDLVAFTLVFGQDIYKRGKPAGPSKVEKMLMHETILERSRNDRYNKSPRKELSNPE